MPAWPLNGQTRKGRPLCGTDFTCPRVLAGARFALVVRGCPGTDWGAPPCVLYLAPRHAVPPPRRASRLSLGLDRVSAYPWPTSLSVMLSCECVSWFCCCSHHGFPALIGLSDLACGGLKGGGMRARTAVPLHCPTRDGVTRQHHHPRVRRRRGALRVAQSILVVFLFTRGPFVFTGRPKVVPFGARWCPGRSALPARQGHE